MSDTVKQEQLELDDTVKTNKTGNPILGRLSGPCADFINPTRNGRKYTQALWEKVFNNPIVKEYFACGGIPGELDHPTDRTETCSEKIAIMMPEPPKKNSNGELIANFDILDTPNGRITYTLAKYGYKLGISSRGSGDTYTNMDGEEQVDEDSYDFQAFDVVLLPAVKTARLNFTESLKTDQKSFKAAINESLQKATDEERKIMEETLKNLSLDENLNTTPEKDLHIDEVTEDVAVDNNEAMMEELQKSLKQNQSLEEQVIALQEKLSVCYAKETRQEELITRYKNSITNLSEKASVADGLRSRINILQERYNDSITTINKQQKEIKKLNNAVSKNSDDKQNLSEKYLTEQNTVKSLNDKLNSLTESYETLQKDLVQKNTEYSKKLQNANALVEKYQKIARGAVDKYIECQSLRLGITKEEIKNKLPESYNFQDIDNACNDLRTYKLNMSRLPFSTQKINENAHMKISSSKNEAILPHKNIDDEVDEQLLDLAGL